METLTRRLSDLVKIPSTHSRAEEIARCAGDARFWAANGILGIV